MLIVWGVELMNHSDVGETNCQEVGIVKPATSFNPLESRTIISSGSVNYILSVGGMN